MLRVHLNTLLGLVNDMETKTAAHALIVKGGSPVVQNTSHIEGIKVAMIYRFRIFMSRQQLLAQKNINVDNSDDQCR